MRGRFLPLAGVAALLVLIAITFGHRTVQAQQGRSVTLTMVPTENREPGVAGAVTITALGNNQLRIDVRVTGLPPNDAARPSHIHVAPGARCDTGAPVVYPFTNATVDANGVGTSSTVITLTPDKPVPANNAYINFHDPKPPNNGQGVICANITFDLSAFAAGGPVALPATGDGSYEDPDDPGDMEE